MIEDLKPYPEYKDSGLPWLGSVPAHWNMKRMKHLFSIRNTRGFPDEPMLAATQTKGVVRKDHYGSRTVLALKDLHQLKLVEVGDFVISLRSFQGGIEYARHRGIISPAYTILYANDASTHGYFASLFKSRPFIDVLRLYVTGIRQGQNIDYGRLSLSSLPIPPQDERQAIAFFVIKLNKACARFIRNRRRLIKVLNEQKQAIINQAVICGVDPDTPLKPSGVDWLGDIPAEWEVLRGKYLFREVDTRSRDGREPHLSMSQKFGLVPASQLNERHFLSSSYAGGKLVHKGDIVLNRLKAHLGVFQLAWQDGVISPDYTVFRPLYNHSARYFELVLRSSAIRPELSCRVKGLVEGFWRLYTDDFYNIQLPVPPAKEQLRIVESCQVETAELDAAIRIAQREINLIREYRTRLISDVVTGKINVRHLAPPPCSEDLEETFEALEPLEDAMADVEMDDKEDFNESD